MTAFDPGYSLWGFFELTVTGNEYSTFVKTTCVEILTIAWNSQTSANTSTNGSINFKDQKKNTQL